MDSLKTTYPELPTAEAYVKVWFSTQADKESLQSANMPYFTADQMREYAGAARAAILPQVGEANPVHFYRQRVGGRWIEKDDGPANPADYLDHRTFEFRTLYATSASLGEAKAVAPVAWWNGFRTYDEREGSYPSFREEEDTNHDIPLYSGVNPYNLAAPVAQALPSQQTAYYEIGIQEGVKRCFDLIQSIIANSDNPDVNDIRSDIAEELLEYAPTFKTKWLEIKELEKRIQSKALPVAAEKTQEPKYTTGHCAENKKKGGCQLHNVHCGYPTCDRRLVQGEKP